MIPITKARQRKEFPQSSLDFLPLSLKSNSYHRKTLAENDHLNTHTGSCKFPLSLLALRFQALLLICHRQFCFWSNQLAYVFPSPSLTPFLETTTQSYLPTFLPLNKSCNVTRMCIRQLSWGNLNSLPKKV